MQGEAIDNLVKAINERHPCWGVQVKGWELFHKPGHLIVILLAEANCISFHAPLVVISQQGEVILGGAGYINFGLRYSTIRSCPEAAAVPIAAYLVGRYLIEIAQHQHFKPTMYVYPDFKEAYSQIQWREKDLMKPTMGAKAVVKKRSHQITVVYYPDIEVETDIYDAPQVIKAGLAFSII